MNRWMKYGVIFILFFVGGALFYNKVYIPKSTYKKVVAKKGDMDVFVFGIGNVGAKDIYSVNALSGTKILEIKKDAGDWVKKGEVLVVMDAVDLPQLIEEAKIAVTKASLELVALKKEFKMLLSQKDLAAVTYERYKKLKEQSFVSQSEFDKAKSEYDVVNAQIAATKVRMVSAEKEVERMKKSVEALKVKLSKYTIVSPVDGYVVEREADVSESVLPTQPILKIVDPETLWVKAYIDEKISGDIKVGQSVKIKLRSRLGETFSGYVERIAPQSDAVTGEREIDVSFEKLPTPFYINEEAEVFITTKRLEDVIKIPSDFLVYKNGLSGVWIDKNGRALFRRVKVLALSEDEAAVDGIDTKSKIIFPSKNKKPLFDGSRVR